MRDLIDRQAAIDLVERLETERLRGNIELLYAPMLKGLKKLPTADPGLDEWCTDCKEYDKERCGCPRFNRVIRETLSELRKRETGTWIYCEDMCGVDGYRCDKCGFHVPWDYKHKFIDFIKEYNFCPNCGADMREEKHEAN